MFLGVCFVLSLLLQQENKCILQAWEKRSHTGFQMLQPWKAWRQNLFRIRFSVCFWDVWDGVSDLRRALPCLLVRNRVSLLGFACKVLPLSQRRWHSAFSSVSACVLSLKENQAYSFFPFPYKQSSLLIRELPARIREWIRELSGKSPQYKKLLPSISLLKNLLYN